MPVTTLTLVPMTTIGKKRTEVCRAEMKSTRWKLWLRVRRVQNAYEPAKRLTKVLQSTGMH